MLCFTAFCRPLSGAHIQAWDAASDAAEQLWLTRGTGAPTTPSIPSEQRDALAEPYIHGLPVQHASEMMC